MKVQCTICRGSKVKTVVDYGLQPPANQFLPVDETAQYYPLSLGYCSECNTIQLSRPMPFKAIESPFPWITYTEPEGHLDDVASILRYLPNISPSSSVLGITYKDQSTLDRLHALGIKKTTSLSKEEFSIFRSPSVQSKTKGVDLLIARHVVEHARDATAFMYELKSLLSEGGYLVLELPACEKIFQKHHHPFIWEEHFTYFTEESLNTLIQQVKGKLVCLKRYPYPYEDSLIAVLRFSFSKGGNTRSHTPEPLLRQFSQSLQEEKRYWRGLLSSYPGPIALFGGGHLGVKWVNFFELGDLIDCVIDDNPHKRGRYMPGSGLPIFPSPALEDRKIQVCVSTLSSESEKKVKEKLSRYFHRGGIWIPAFH